VVNDFVIPERKSGTSLKMRASEEVKEIENQYYASGLGAQGEEVHKGHPDLLSKGQRRDISKANDGQPESTRVPGLVTARQVSSESFNFHVP